MNKQMKIIISEFEITEQMLTGLIQVADKHEENLQEVIWRAISRLLYDFFNLKAEYALKEQEQ